MELRNMKEFSPYNAYDIYEKLKKDYPKAKGYLAGLGEKKKMIIAIMMKKSNESSLGAQEREAYASAEFEKYCNDIDAATAKEALLKLELTQAQMEFEAWRSEQATNRNIERITR
jgi:hypothetical protein